MIRKGIVAVFLGAWLLPTTVWAGNLIRFSENAIVPAEIEIEDLVVINGNAEIAGKVKGNVVVVRGNVKLRQLGIVAGDIICLGGKIFAEPGSVVKGTKVEIGGQIGWKSLPIFSIGKLLLFSFFIKLALSLVMLVVCLFLVIMWPDQIRYAADEMGGDLVKSSLVGLFAVAIMIPLCIGFAVSLLGIPIAIALALFMLVANWFGVATVAYLIGHKLSARFSALIAILIGLIIIKIIHFIPFLGGVLYFLAVLPGVGAILLTRFGTNEPWLGAHHAKTAKGTGRK